MKTFSRAFSCANAKAPALPRVSPFFLPIGSLFILWKSGFKVQTNAHYLRDNVVLLRMRLKIHSCVAVSCCECYSMSWSLCITGKMGVKFIIWGKRYSNFHLIINSLSESSRQTSHDCAGKCCVFFKRRRGFHRIFNELCRKTYSMALEAGKFRCMYSIMPTKATYGYHRCRALYSDVNCRRGKHIAIWGHILLFSAV